MDEEHIFTAERNLGAQLWTTFSGNGNFLRTSGRRQTDVVNRTVLFCVGLDLRKMPAMA
jgi:hypothetical protein